MICYAMICYTAATPHYSSGVNKCSVSLFLWRVMLFLFLLMKYTIKQQIITSSLGTGILNRSKPFPFHAVVAVGSTSPWRTSARKHHFVSEHRVESDSPNRLSNTRCQDGECTHRTRSCRCICGLHLTLLICHESGDFLCKKFTLNSTHTRSHSVLSF